MWASTQNAERISNNFVPSNVIPATSFLRKV
jgi:hypothetical protein